MILTSGCFDGIHAGHVSFLTKLHALTHQQIHVAVAPDAYIAKYKSHAPRWGEQARIDAVKGLSHVADAFLHGPEGVDDVLGHCAHLSDGMVIPKWTGFAKGFDWYLHPKAGRIEELCQARGIALIFIDSGFDGHSSS